jgi:hypothetical protein
MSSFDNLVSVALDEASLGDYMRKVKAAARATTHGVAATAKLAGNIAQGAGKVYSAIGGTQGGAMLQKVGGATANVAGNVVKSMQELGATAQEEEVMRKLFGENPKKGDKINIELPGIQAPGAVITDVKPGVKDDSMYTVDLFPTGKLTSFKMTAQSANSTGFTDEQRTIQAAKDKSPIDKIIFTKGIKDYGSTNVKLSLYKANKLVAARNIPGLKDNGGLHFNGTGKPWTINLDSSDSIDFADIAAFVANDKSLNLTPEQMKQVVGARDYPQLKQTLTKLGKGDKYMQAYTNAITALRQGKTAPQIPQSNNPAAGGNQQASTDNTKGINARTADGQPVPGQTRYTTTDKKKTYLYGKDGWKQQDPSTKKWSIPVQQQAQVTAAWQKSQNITPTAKPTASAGTPSAKATRRATQTKGGTPVQQPTAADAASMNLPGHPVTNTTPPNRRTK